MPIGESNSWQQSDDSSNAEPPTQTSTLINFPGVTNRITPEWRKTLNRRVREVQERRAREAAEDPARGQIGSLVAPNQPSLLEIVPRQLSPDVNPIVKSALERLDRARRIDPRTAEPLYQQNGHAEAAAAAMAPLSEATPEVNDAPVATETAALPTRPAREYTLVVVPPPVKPEPKSIGLISDDAGVLSYLDQLVGTALVEPAPILAVGFGVRIVAGFLDLVFIGFLAAPIAAGIELSQGNWNDPRIQGLMAGAAVATMFLYLAISITADGQTWGMRLLSIRAIDSKTGFLPTGGQSARRALGYMFTLATLGLGLVFALLDSDKRTLHDRLSGTIVVRE